MTDKELLDAITEFLDYQIIVADKYNFYLKGEKQKLYAGLWVIRKQLLKRREENAREHK